MIAFRRITPITILFLLVAALTPMAHAQTNRVTFPADFDQMVMYGDYRRGLPAWQSRDISIAPYGR